MPDKIYFGRRAKEVTKSPPFDGTTGIRMVMDDQNELTAGTDNGYVWEIESPWASQSQADWLLSQMQGFEYQPYNADAFQPDPAAEIGDYVTVGGVYSGLWNERISYGKMLVSEIEAPQPQDVDHEYQYKTASERKFARMAKYVSAEFRVQAAEIAAKVSEVGGDNSSFGWSMTTAGMFWYANGSEIMKATQAGLEVVGHIKGGTISIGSNFSVDAYGNMRANSATLTGTLSVGGSQISAWQLRSGADSGYQWANGSYGGTSPWQYSLVGGGYGFNFNNASQYSTSSYGDYFHVKDLWAHRSITFEGYPVSRATATIGGTTINYLKWTR